MNKNIIIKQWSNLICLVTNELFWQVVPLLFGDKSSYLCADNISNLVMLSFVFSKIQMHLLYWYQVQRWRQRIVFSFSIWLSILYSVLWGLLVVENQRFFSQSYLFFIFVLEPW